VIVELRCTLYVAIKTDFFRLIKKLIIVMATMEEEAIYIGDKINNFKC
jgi:hypothetical protein